MRFIRTGPALQEQARVDELIKELLQKAEAANQAHQGEAEPAELPLELADEQKRQQAIKAALERIQQRAAEQKEQKDGGTIEIVAEALRRFNLANADRRLGPES